MHAGGGLFGDALQVLHDLVEDAGLLLGDILEEVLDDLHFVVVGGGIHPLVAVFHLVSLVDEEGHVAAVIDDELRAFVAGEHDGLPGAPPVFFECLALPGKDGRAGGSDGGRGVVLGGENVAGGPADIGAEFLQRLDEHAGLDGHVQGAGDADASEGLFRAVLLTGGHEAGHFAFSDVEFLTAEVGEGDVFDFVVAHSGRGWVQVRGLKRFKSTYQDTLICPGRCGGSQTPILSLFGSGIDQPADGGRLGPPRTVMLLRSSAVPFGHFQREITPRSRFWRGFEAYRHRSHVRRQCSS